MGAYRYFFGLVFASLCVAPGCSNLIGLNGYSVAGTGGELNTSGRVGDAAAGGTSAAGLGGALTGTAGVGGLVGSAGADLAGGGGAPPACPDGCDDANECTVDACVSDECVHQPADIMTACGMGQSCDAQGVCVRCLDTAAGTAQDMGCPATAPVCIGTGADAVCGGCTKATDCDDGNECTNETCLSAKCVTTSVAPGVTCAGGVCNGAAPEKCVVCTDTVAGPAADPGCTAAKPACDTTTGTATCYACVKDADCATDNVSCTVETCTNHACAHVPTDSKCLASADVCKPNKCDALLDCKPVDISMSKPLMTSSSSLGNGSFESSDGSNGAEGWAQIGTLQVVYNCTGSGCVGTNGTTFTAAGNSNYLAWLGGTSAASISGLDHLIHLPAGTVKIQIAADGNFQTKSIAASNKDSFELRLLNEAQVQIGPALVTKTNADAQTGAGATSWTSNAVNVTTDVSAYANQDLHLVIWSSVDGALKTDFFIDNVRVTATVCQ